MLDSYRNAQTIDLLQHQISFGDAWRHRMISEASDGHEASDSLRFLNLPRPAYANAQISTVSGKLILAGGTVPSPLTPAWSILYVTLRINGC